MVGVNYVTCLTKPIKYINIPDVDVMSWFDHHTGSFTHVPFVQEETLLQPPTVNTIVHEPTCFQHVDVEQQWSARYRCDALTGSVPLEHSIQSLRIHECPYCQSLLYKPEFTTGPHGKFGRCCGNGNIQLPNVPPVPSELNRIFRQPTYRAMSRKLNHAMAFACWKCNEDKSLIGRYQSISCIRIKGCAYMLVGSIEPEDPERARPRVLQFQE